MVDIERIEGRRLKEVLDHLVEERTLIKVSFPAKDYTHLTLILGTEKIKGKQYFSIDLTDELVDIFNSRKIGKLIFEFNGPDKVGYRFTTDGTLTRPGRVLVPFPAFIERIQKRSNFRIKTAPETVARFMWGDRRHKLRIENISLGGLYGLTSNPQPENLSAGDVLSRLEIFFPVNDQCVMITIDKAVVRRVERRKRAGRNAYAMEFIEIGRDSRQLLTRQIYDLQRIYLKRRIKF